MTHLLHILNLVEAVAGRSPDRCWVFLGNFVEKRHPNWVVVIEKNAVERAVHSVVHIVHEAAMICVFRSLGDLVG